ncbi:hypothetical protein CKM354_000764200 [Cercospora kikuchii]|uniref:Uncharacterized protein n=1 Tax=Cercospora kikuchii TaxID=84275 RepID=A0A9P3FJ86_9PEZI|nr:uncharacterized protein CKM354_000764200 [Cercospora kikuchii]GIZ44445.1 hypothetical protein CKM354_000764200 [Cercospora kikuchii]
MLRLEIDSGASSNVRTGPTASHLRTLFKTTRHCGRRQATGFVTYVFPFPVDDIDPQVLGDGSAPHRGDANPRGLGRFYFDLGRFH